MIRVFHDIEQGTEEWDMLRLGRVTSSRFQDVMTKGKKKDVLFGKTAVSYLYSLLCEKYTLEARFIHSKATEWGSIHEPIAREEYEDRTFINVEKIGFCSLGDYIGASTDGLVSHNGILEIKCPENPSNHLDYCLNGVPKKYIPQIQGGLFVTGREYCDFVSYDPRFNERDCFYLERVYRDETYIDALEDRLNKFIDLYKKYENDFYNRQRIKIL